MIRRLMIFFAAVVMTATTFVYAKQANAGRVALVVGNAAYENTQPLANPRNDAEAMAASLRELGFEVFDGYDLTRSAFEDLIRDFARGAQDADAALLYYAGHGLEVASVNYLVPVDAMIRDETDLEFETISLADIIRLMEREQRTNLVFLDACRDNPMARNLSLNMGTRSVAVGRGLAPVETGIGTLIAYSTQPGNVALDGEGRHSPFTDALLDHIATPELDVEIMMRRVRRDVMQVTGGLQVPWSSSSLTGSFKFKLEPLQTSIPVPAPAITPEAVATPQPAAEPEVAAVPQTPDVAETPEVAEEPEVATVPEVADAAAAAETPDVAEVPDAPTEAPAGFSIVVSETADTEAPDGKEIQLSSLDPAIATSAPREGAVLEPRAEPLSARELARLSQAELNRLGCNAGVEDGIWGRNSQSALERLVEHAPTLELAALAPSEALLGEMAKLDGRICPLVCLATEDLIDGSCVRKTCPSGQRLSSRGSCYTPQAASQRSTSRSRSGSNCFTYNGQTYCN